MKVQCTPLGIIGANFYIVKDEKSNEAFVIDPGSEGENAVNLIRECGCELKYVILTHAHADHIGALDDVKNAFPNAKVVIGKDDAESLNDCEKSLCNRFRIKTPKTTADISADENTVLHIGENELKIITTPGHTKGGICILAGDMLFSGDTLFNLSVGRCDFYGGNSEALANSIVNKLFTLNPDTTVYPGHGNPTAIGFELENNPFI